MSYTVFERKHIWYLWFLRLDNPYTVKNADHMTVTTLLFFLSLRRLSLFSFPCSNSGPFFHYHVVILGALALIALIFLSHMGPCFTLTFPHVSYLGSWLISQSAFNRYLWLSLVSLCSTLHLVVTWSVRESLMYLNYDEDSYSLHLDLGQYT